MLRARLFFGLFTLVILLWSVGASAIVLINDSGRRFDARLRAEYVPIMDHEALEAFQLLTRIEGIIPALEPSHALAEVIKRAPTMGKDEIILMNLSGRGDKDIFTVGKILGMEL